MSQKDDFNAIVRNDFYFFMQRAFATLNPGTEFMDNWHLQAICHALHRTWRGEITRLIITVPPRYGKSICSSIAFPAFIHGHDPTQRIVVASYGAGLSTELSNSTRKVMKSPWYRSAFPNTIIDPTKDTEELVRTTQGGHRLATSVGGSVTGLGGGWIIIDDPMKATLAPSENDLNAVINYYSGALYSRLDNKKAGRIILIMQRIHEEDLVGYLTQQEGWHHLNLPAIAEVDQDIDLSDEEYYHRPAGEVLHPERESHADLMKVKSQLGPYAFSAQYQQSPTPMHGGVVKWEWFKSHKRLPNGGRDGFITQSWDTAMSLHESSSYSVCTTWFCYQDRYYLTDVWRQRLESPDLLTFIHQHALRHNANLVIIEEQNGSKALIEMLLRHTRLNLAWLRPTESKVQRMIGELPAISDGRVSLPEHADWMPTFRNEIIKFPGGKFDDQADSVSQFLNWARLVGPNVPNGGGRRGLGWPNGPVGPQDPSAESMPYSRVTIFESEPPDLDFSSFY